MRGPVLSSADAATMEEYRNAELQAIPHVFPNPILLTPEAREQYRQDLIGEYMAVRQKQYEYTVWNETMKAYNFAKDAEAAGVTANFGMWNNYDSYVNAQGISAAERERRQTALYDCAFHRGRDLSRDSCGGRLGSGSYNSCAITACSVMAQISGKMGFDGQDNIMHIDIPRDKHAYHNDTLGAPGIANCDSIPQPYRNFYDDKERGRDETLNDMMTAQPPKLQVGDAFAIYTGNDGSRYHAMTIAAIEYEGEGENRKVKSYTVQCNNNPHLVTINADGNGNSGAAKYYADRHMGSYTHVQNCMMDRIEAEAQNMSIEELQSGILEARTETGNLIGELRATEEYNFSQKYYGEFGLYYNRCVDFAKNGGMPEIEEQHDWRQYTPMQGFGRGTPRLSSTQGDDKMEEFAATMQGHHQSRNSRVTDFRNRMAARAAEIRNDAITVENLRNGTTDRQAYLAYLTGRHTENTGTDNPRISRLERFGAYTEASEDNAQNTENNNNTTSVAFAMRFGNRMARGA